MNFNKLINCISINKKFYKESCYFNIMKMYANKTVEKQYINLIQSVQGS